MKNFTIRKFNYHHREKMTHKSKNYSIKLQKNYFCNGTENHLYIINKQMKKLRGLSKIIYLFESLRINKKGMFTGMEHN